MCVRVDSTLSIAHCSFPLYVMWMYVAQHYGFESTPQAPKTNKNIAKQMHSKLEMIISIKIFGNGQSIKLAHGSKLFG